MLSLAEIDLALEARPGAPRAEAERLLGLGEQVLEHWLSARELQPTETTREGFRLLALHRQGAKGDPGFNACRETARELAWHYNLVSMDPDHAETKQRLEMMRLVARHLYLFISGRMEVAGLGEFCCSSRPLRLKSDTANI